MRIKTIMHALRLQWECYLTKQTHGVRVKVTVGICGNGENREVQAWCTRHLAASVIHSFSTARPPACRRTTHAADHTRALSRPNSRLAAVYLWLAIAKAASHCPERLKLFDAAKTRGAHTHTSWRHQAASVVWASPGVERRDAWQINCWYGIEFHAAHCGLSDRRGWPDGAALQTAVCPVLGTITKKSIGPIPIPPNTGKYWPIPQYRYHSNPMHFLFQSFSTSNTVL